MTILPKMVFIKRDEKFSVHVKEVLAGRVYVDILDASGHAKDTKDYSETSFEKSFKYTGEMREEFLDDFATSSAAACGVEHPGDPDDDELEDPHDAEAGPSAPEVHYDIVPYDSAAAADHSSGSTERVDPEPVAEAATPETDAPTPAPESKKERVSVKYPEPEESPDESVVRHELDIEGKGKETRIRCRCGQGEIFDGKVGDRVFVAKLNKMLIEHMHCLTEGVQQKLRYGHETGQQVPA